MDEQDLHELIESLHDEIQNTESVDDKGRELLAHLDGDIRKLLTREGGMAAPVHPSTLKRMQEGLDHFEVTHPALTMLLAKVMEALSNVGI